MRSGHVPAAESPCDLGEVIFLLTSESFVCKTWRMVWLQLHGSKARTNQLVSSCGSVDEPHVPLGSAEELCLYPCVHSPHPARCLCALVTGSAIKHSELLFPRWESRRVVGGGGQQGAGSCWHWACGPSAVMAAGCCNNESAFLLRQG